MAHVSQLEMWNCDKNEPKKHYTTMLVIYRSPEANQR